jgi:hypothetical protein
MAPSGASRRKQPPSSQTTFKVTFNPTKKGSRKTTLRIKSNAVGGSPFDVQLTGLAVK